MNALSEPAAPPPVRTFPATTYRLRLAGTQADLEAAQRLRYEVFNLELGGGLPQSHGTGRDADPFDAQCDHLLVEDTGLAQVVGTYRLQTGSRAAAGLGFYSAREFDFSPFEARRSEMLELGRACIHRQHRNLAVLNLLWKGIAAYAQQHRVRYLLGCSSLTSRDERDGASAYLKLAARHLAPAPWRTSPWPALACGMAQAESTAPAIPRLLSAYLSLGAAICGPPALDREFGSIDFLTWLDARSPALASFHARGVLTRV